MRSVLIGSVASGLTVWALLFALLRSKLAWRIAVDQPNQRSLHSRAIPRIGGLVVVGIALISMSIVARGIQVITVTAVTLMLIFAVDDRRGLSVPTRLFVQLIAASVASLALLPAGSWWLISLTIVAIMWTINLYNFMDGADGLAGGMAVFGFGAFAVVAESAGAREVAIASACIGGAAVGFLFHNFPPAKVFLGDAGSVPLGFLASTIGVTGWKQGLWPVWFPILVFSPFIVDATVTLVRRGLEGRPVWEAHREHLYQRMVTGGLGHARTAAAWYGLMFVVAASAIAAVSWPFRWQIGLLIGWIALYAVLYAIVGRLMTLGKNEA